MLKYNIKYIYFIQSYTNYIVLDYNSNYMFQPNCRAKFRLLFEQVECTTDNAFNLRDIALQELVKIIVVSYVEDLPL